MAPRDVAHLAIEVRMGQRPGVQRDRFWLRTNHQQQPLLICRWQAQVVKPPPTAATENSERKAAEESMSRSHPSHSSSKHAPNLGAAPSVSVSQSTGIGKAEDSFRLTTIEFSRFDREFMSTSQSPSDRRVFGALGADLIAGKKVFSGVFR